MHGMLCASIHSILSIATHSSYSLKRWKQLQALLCMHPMLANVTGTKQSNSIQHSVWQQLTYMYGFLVLYHILPMTPHFELQAIHSNATSSCCMFEGCH